jgi:hypothetical protein
MTDSQLRDVEAYVFDVFGTVVDWKGSMVKQLSAHGIHEDGELVLLVNMKPVIISDVGWLR